MDKFEYDGEETVKMWRVEGEDWIKTYIKCVWFIGVISISRKGGDWEDATVTAMTLGDEDITDFYGTSMPRISMKYDEIQGVPVFSVHGRGVARGSVDAYYLADAMARAVRVVRSLEDAFRCGGKELIAHV